MDKPTATQEPSYLDLTERCEALTATVETLTATITKQDKRIKELAKAKTIADPLTALAAVIEDLVNGETNPARQWSYVNIRRELTALGGK